MTADEAFEMCAVWLENNADLHQAYSDPKRDRFREAAARDKWKWSAEFLEDAARHIRRFQDSARTSKT